MKKVWETEEWKKLKEHVQYAKKLHLRELLRDETRNMELCISFDSMTKRNIFFDYSRQNVTHETMQRLFELAKTCRLNEKIKALSSGEKINATENRSVLHMALRAKKGSTFTTDGKDVVIDVHSVLDRIASFTENVRTGKWLGASGKVLTNVVSIGIGGSYLGPEFLAEALKTDEKARKAASGRTLRFLANVDPVDVARALDGLDPETTLVIVCSKTFTTAETMLNARTVLAWLKRGIKGYKNIAARHIVACSANLVGTEAFGILPENVFGFWDWVGGRYSVSSAIGMLPISLQYGFEVARDFLDGAAEIDNHFISKDLESNLPVIMGLLSIWNSTFLGYPARALLPYSQALMRFPAHIQQVDMESNGKRVTVDGTVIPFDAGEINFGEPGTNGQHSFYQLLHQGRVIPCDFIGSCTSQQPVDRVQQGEVVTNHDELMSNFFAQPDALAIGKSKSDLEAEGVPEYLWPHKEFPGNRPSSSLLFSKFDSYSLGQLLALYEHRTVVQGFIWGINSFDQWGVELGKTLAKKVRNELSKTNKGGSISYEKFNSSTATLLRRYLDIKKIENA
jgi:glucose-6-phosphate isomerase